MTSEWEDKKVMSSKSKDQQIIEALKESLNNDSLNDLFFYAQGVIKAVNILGDSDIKAKIVNSEVFNKIVEKAGFFRPTGN